MSRFVRCWLSAGQILRESLRVGFTMSWCHYCFDNIRRTETIRKTRKGFRRFFVVIQVIMKALACFLLRAFWMRWIWNDREADFSGIKKRESECMGDEIWAHLLIWWHLPQALRHYVSYKCRGYTHDEWTNYQSRLADLLWEMQCCTFAA